MTAKKSHNQKLITEYAKLINEFAGNNSTIAWSGTFLANKDRFHSPFLSFFLNIYQQNTATISLPKMNLNICNLCNKILRWIGYLMRSMFYIIYANWHFQNKKKLTKNQKITKAFSLIKSFSFERSFSNNGFKDEFFGDLAQTLQQNHIPYLTIVDPLNSPLKAIKNLVESENVFPFYAFNHPLDVFVVVKEVLQGAFNPPQGSPIFKKMSLRQVMLKQFYHDLFNPILLQGILMGLAAKRIAKIIPLDTFFLTYENLNWERPMIKLLRQSAPQIKVVGFQHAIIAESCTNYFIAADEDHSGLPNLVVTNGLATKEILEEYGQYQSIKIRTGAATRQKYIFNLRPNQRQNNKVLLVALEGTLQTVDCANYVFKHINKLKDWKIILRTHPILPIEKMRPLFSIDISKYQNISISSKQKIAEDIEQSAAVIYWGTTVSLEAMAQNRPVIHYNRGDILSYDPVFKFNELFKQTVTDESDLKAILENILNTNDEKFESEKQKALNYINDYFHPVTTENMQNFIV